MKKSAILVLGAMALASCTKENKFSFSEDTIEVSYEAQELVLTANQAIDSYRIIDGTNSASPWYSLSSMGGANNLALSVSSNLTGGKRSVSIEAKSGGLSAVVDVWQEPQAIEIIFY